MERSELEGELEAYVLDILGDRTAQYERALAIHPDLQQRAADLHEVLASLAVGGGSDPADSLRARVLMAALTERPAGIHSEIALPATPVALYREVVADLAGLLADLAATDMAAETIYRIPVVELISHLSVVEAYVGDRLGLAPFGGDSSQHVSMRDDVDLGDPTALVARWRARSTVVVDRVAHLTSDELSRPIEFHGFQIPIQDMLIGRGFELWTHGEDICRATGRVPRPPSGSGLTTMAEGGVRLLRMMLSFDATHRGKSIRLNLIGSGGGSWAWAIGDADVTVDPFDPCDTTLTVDVVEFCRLLAARVEPELLDSYVDGDAALARHVIDIAPLQADYGAGPVK